MHDLQYLEALFAELVKELASVSGSWRVYTLEA